MELGKFFGVGKRGVFFSADALIALIIILFVVVIAFPVSNFVQPDSDIHSDILFSLSNLKVSEVESTYVDSLISQGVIKDTNKSLLQQIGELYVTNITVAELLARDVLQEINTTENVGVWYGDTLVYSNNRTGYDSARNVDIARQVISGIQAGQNITGFSARAFLSSNLRSNYFYFGGYVGDGNISARVVYSGNITSEAEIELVVSDDFDLYVNDVFVGSFNKSPSDFEPVRHNFSTGDFSPGANIVELRGDNLFVAGGFVKILYYGDTPINGAGVYRFPGISGLINLYDGFYVPANLSSMNISLHLDTNFSAFLNIGNVTVFNGTTNGAQTITIDNATLSSMLDYSTLEGRTIPLRLGLDNATYIGIAQEIDVFSVTDISGSMAGQPLIEAKNATELLVDFILNTIGNRVGLVAYQTDASWADFHGLSTNDVSLKAEANSWVANGFTCICCGINRAVDGFFLSSVGEGQLLAYYDFDDAVSGTISDKGGLGNDGTVSGTPTSVSGAEDNAFSFDGTQRIAVPDLITSDEGTISFWFDPDSDNSQTIFDASTPSKYFFVDIDSGDDLRFWTEDVNDADFQGSEQDVNNIHQSGWHHVAAVWRFNGAPSTELYLDGSLIDQDSDSAGAIADFLDGYIGETRSSYFTTWDFEGDIDEFRIYSRALNLTEIQGLNTLSGTCGNDVVEAGEVCDGASQWCSSGGNNGTMACASSCDAFLSCNTTVVCGDGVSGSGEQCDDGNLVDGDGCSSICELEDRFRSMVVMSDGVANRECTEQGVTGDLDSDGTPDTARDDAIQASIDACDDHGIVTHAVGFGAGADEDTLRAIALNNNCNGSYYYSDSSNLSNVYQQIANSIVTEYVEQTLQSTGSITTELFADSYIDFVYQSTPVPYGLVITGESLFDDDSGGQFAIPSDAIPVETNVVSYSGPRWTTTTTVNGNTVFNLSSYNTDYVQIGDPYQVTVRDSIVQAGVTNYANVTTGVSETNQTTGSQFNKIIYTIAKNASTFSDIKSVASGCIWNIQLEDDSVVVAQIPDTYVGVAQCYFNQTNPTGLITNPNDAYQLAVRALLVELDLNGNGKVDILFTEQDLQITLSQISGIPFSFFTEVQVRRWVS